MSYTLTDTYGRTVTVAGNIYSVPGITIEAPSDAQALTTLNGMAPASYTPPPVVQTTIGSLAFIRRFTVAEQTAITAANPLWGLQIAAAGAIDVTDPTLITDMQAAVTAGVLTTARMIQVLDLSISSP